jgi:hypothetical protein
MCGLTATALNADLASRCSAKPSRKHNQHSSRTKPQHGNPAAPLTPMGTMSTCSQTLSTAPSMMPATMLPAVMPAARPGGWGLVG